MPARVLAAALCPVLAGLIAASAGATAPGTNGALIWQRESRTSPPRLWVASPDGSGARQVFAGGRNRGEVEGAFSPADPSVVVFTRVARTPFSEDLYRGDLATGAVTRLTRASSADLAPAFSPDGARLAYWAAPRPRRPDPARPAPPERIHLMAPDGTADVAITSPGRRSIDPDWSPDGTRIAYVEARLDGPRRLPRNRLMVMNADGSSPVALTEYGGGDEINPKWMPDGRTIVFELLQPGGSRSDVMAIDAQGGPTRPILATAAWETNPVPSPDGTRIAFTSDRDRRGRYRLGPGFELYTMAVDGTDVRRVTTNRRPDIWPDWQRLP